MFQLFSNHTRVCSVKNNSSLFQSTKSPPRRGTLYILNFTCLTLKISCILPRRQRPSYQITAMTYETELAQLSNELMRDVIGTKQIAIPYKYVRSHHNQLNGQQSYNVRITDAAQNLENTYSIIHKPQAIQTSVSSTNEHNSNSEPTTFYGGRETWEGDEIGGADDDLTKYVFKYGTKFFPNAPVELDGRNKTLALQSAISQLGLRNPVASNHFTVRTIWVRTGTLAISSSSIRSKQRVIELRTASTRHQLPLQLRLTFPSPKRRRTNNSLPLWNKRIHFTLRTTESLLW